MERWKQLGALALFVGVGGAWVGWAGCGPRTAPATAATEATPGDVAPEIAVPSDDVVLPSSKAFVPPPDWEPPTEQQAPAELPVVLPSSKAARPPVVLPSSKAAVVPPDWEPPEQPVLLPSSKAGVSPEAWLQYEKEREDKEKEEKERADQEEAAEEANTVEGDIDEQDGPDVVESPE